MRIRSLAAAVAPVVAVAAVVVAGGSANAATHTPRHTKPAHVRVHGVVVHRAGNRLTVLAHDVTVGRHTIHNRVETVLLTPRSARVTRAIAGDVVTATGDSTTGSTVRSATLQAAVPQPAQALLGVVASVDGPLVTLTPRDAADGEHDGHDGAHGVIVDTMTAAFTGAASSAAALTAGDYVAVLGEENEGEFAAAKVYSYAAQPEFLVGEVSAADQSTNTLTVTSPSDDHEHGDGESGDSENSDTPAAATSVDTSAADVVLNGNDEQQQASNFPAVGDKVLVIGADGSAAQPSTPLAATLVFAFDSGDQQPVGDNCDDGNDQSDCHSSDNGGHEGD